MPTIAAIATPPGQGGIGIVRLSGPGSKSLLARVFLAHSRSFTNFQPWKLHRGALLDIEDSPLDDVLAVYMPAPRTYTGEEMVEVHCHGGAAVVNAALETFLRLGARLALPGEFTKRAYLNGRMDLTQAEAVAEIIAAPTREAIHNSFNRLEGRLASIIEALIGEVDNLRALARVSVDFPDDEIDSLTREEFAENVARILDSVGTLQKASIRANLVANGGRVVLVGPVNSGKSSIFNALGGYERSLVTDLPGTTRDYLEMSLLLDNLPVTLVDTAGINSAVEDKVEKLGIDRTLAQIEEADLVCLVLDSSAFNGDCYQRELDGVLDAIGGRKPLIVWNKTDLSPVPDNALHPFQDVACVETSALAGFNIDKLAICIKTLLLENAAEAEEGIVPPNMRQADVLGKVQSELQALLGGINDNVPYDCCLLHLDETVALLGRIISLASDDTLLDNIFSRFCIGK